MTFVLSVPQPYLHTLGASDLGIPSHQATPLEPLQA